MRGDPSKPEVWAKIAQRDLARAHRMIRDDDVEGCLFHLQQACEKHLKGKLVEKGAEVRRIHNVVTLLDDAEELGISPLISRDTAYTLTREYIASRYPDESDEPVPNKTEALGYLREASQMMGMHAEGEESGESKELGRPGFDPSPPPGGAGGMGGR